MNVIYTSTGLNKNQHLTSIKCQRATELKINDQTGH